MELNESQPAPITHQRISITPGGTKYWIPDCDNTIKPYHGQRFRELHEAVSFYKNYARTVGFNVRNNTLVKARDKTVLWKYVVCSREGYKHHAKVGPKVQGAGHVTRRRVSNRVPYLIPAAEIQKPSPPSPQFHTSDYVRIELDIIEFFDQSSRKSSSDFRILVFCENQAPITHQRISITPGGTKYWILDCDNTIKPYHGQRFRELHEAVSFYKNYARTVGFNVRNNTLVKAHDKTVLWKYVVCPREGYKHHAKVGPKVQGAEHVTRRRVSNRAQVK
ncbi:FAR1-related sequence 7 [Striga asiatica]|uniref:FAR1-related sequence 7 n=1 Tax=Striga asiatica TaxID=4170 RepID=A0A5A7QFA8_STRAF|nr:FAR1-related sequence 7 [Striga asiatica]